jgi:hypothetical protein
MSDDLASHPADHPAAMRLPLTALTGRPVRGVSGRRTGWVRDVVARIGAEGASVTGLLVGDFRDRWLVPCAEVDVLDPSGPRLVHDLPADQRTSTPLEPDELLLVRDVLDCRAYVVAARGSARVGEVWLEESADGILSVAGVEVGTRVVLRRLGPQRWRDRAPGRPLVPLPEVHLVSGRGHIVQLASGGSPVPHLNPHDLAHLLTHLPARAAVDVVRRVPTASSRAALEHLHPRVRKHLGRALDDQAPSGRRNRRTAGRRVDRPRDERQAGRARHT